MLEWLLDNKEWLFSGIAIAIPIALVGWWLSTRSNQNQVSGNNSNNIQAGGNITIKHEK